MIQPISVCIEVVGKRSSSPQFTRCVALPGRQQGLSIDENGQIRWKEGGDVAFELWVSADERLVLFRPNRACPSTVDRKGRTLEVPEEKPVILVHKDEVFVGGKHLRIHLHGPAPQVHEPVPVAPRKKVRRAMLAAATAFMVGATITGSVRSQETDPADADNPDTDVTADTDVDDDSDILVMDAPPCACAVVGGNMASDD